MTAPASIVAELLADCDARGIRLIPGDGGSLTIDSPKGALSPDLLERLKAHKSGLLAKLRPHSLKGLPELLPDALDDDWELADEPGEPCPRCGSLVTWWTISGDARCGACDPPRKALAALERLERIRRRLGLPRPEGSEELLAGLRRLCSTAQTPSAAANEGSTT